MEALQQQQARVACAIHYPASLKRQPALRSRYRAQRFVLRRWLSQPVHAGMQEAQTNCVAGTIREALLP